MTTLSDRTLSHALQALGLPERAAEEPDMQEHMDVLGGCMALYFARNQKYHSAWKQYGAMSQLVRAANKMDRLMAVWWFDKTEDNRPPLTQKDLDDAFDCINHLTFFVRCAMAGNLMGDQPERPALPESSDDVLQFPGMSNIPVTEVDPRPK